MELSIIVPVYNAKPHVARCIESVLAQTFGDFELLLVDDGSTDGSGEICELYAAADTRVRVFHVENGGPSSARNHALEVALGRWIQFVDADDEIEPFCCQALRDVAHGSDVDLVLCGAGIYYEDGGLMRHMALPPDGTYDTAGLLDSVEPVTVGTLLNPAWNKGYRASVIRDAGIRFEADVWKGEDFLFNCAYLTACGIVGVTAQPLYRYYKRDVGTLTRRFHPGEIARRRRMDGALLALYEHHGRADARRDVLDVIFGAAAFDGISTVGLKDCTLTFAGKVGFVREFTDSEYGELIARYGASPGVSATRRLACWLAGRGAAGSLTALVVLVARVKRWRARWRSGQQR